MTAGQSAGCTDDGLGESFEPADADHSGDDLARLHPVGVGDALWYTFFQTFRPTTLSDPNTGLLVDEKQSSGQLCLEVTEVRDTATVEYEDATQTIVVANTRVTGGDGSDEIVVKDQEAGDRQPPEQPDPAVVDEALSGLWLSKLLFPSRGHGMGTAVRKEYTTRTAPHPPHLVYATLPFWEPRISADHAWGGFDWSDADCVGRVDRAACEGALCVWDPSAGECANKAINVVSDMLVYLIQNEGCVSFMSSDTHCDESHVANQMCGMQTEEIGCSTTPQCIWDSADGTCISMSTLTLLWRDKIGEGTGLQDDVLRQIVITYQPNGVLRSWSEVVVPDAGGPLPHAGTLNQCEGSCMTGELQFDKRPIERASCVF